jgi:fatty-acyl-CoA synthase
MRTFDTVAQAIAEVGRAWPGNTYVFQDQDGKEATYTFPQLEADTAGRAAALQAMGLQKGDRLGLIVIDPEDFVLTFFAAIRIGVLPVPLYPPAQMRTLDAYVARTARILEVAGAKVLVASGQLKNILFSLVDTVPGLKRFVATEDLKGAQGTPVYPTITPDDVCFLQFTSGSTADPKGVVVTHGNLIANCKGIIIDGIELDPAKGDKGVSWLPLYHDMGLIGFVIAPLLHGVPVVFIPTMRFVRRPTVWMEAIHRHRGTATFAPNFAYALITKKVKPSDLDQWDLSCLKVCGCGAEPIHPETMRAFTELFHTHCDMPKSAILPAYGMAEATLAMSFKPVSEEFKTTVVDGASFADSGTCAEPVEGEPAFEHVSCGKPFPGHEVVAMNPEGQILPQGVQGELCFRGASVTKGYWQNPEATAAAFRDGWLHTGDLGYVLDDEVYVTGRLKDLIILNGRNLHPQEVEWVVGEIEGVRKGNVVAFSRPGADSEELVIVLETRVEDKTTLAATIRTAVQRDLGLGIGDIVMITPGNLPKTTSGKLQRRKTRDDYLAGALGSDTVRGGEDSAASKVVVAKHVAKSLWSRAKAAVRG